MEHVAHTDKKNLDLNEDGEVLATVLNMEEIQSRHESPRRVVTWSRSTGEQFSANPGDYFAAEPGEALVDGMGEDMLLAYVTPERVEPIKDVIGEVARDIDEEMAETAMGFGWLIEWDGGWLQRDRLHDATQVASGIAAAMDDEVRVVPNYSPPED